MYNGIVYHFDTNSHRLIHSKMGSGIIATKYKFLT